MVQNWRGYRRWEALLASTNLSQLAMICPFDLKICSLCNLSPLHIIFNFILKYVFGDSVTLSTKHIWNFSMQVSVKHLIWCCSKQCLLTAWYTGRESIKIWCNAVEWKSIFPVLFWECSKNSPMPNAIWISLLNMSDTLILYVSPLLSCLCCKNLKIHTVILRL